MPVTRPRVGIAGSTWSVTWYGPRLPAEQPDADGIVDHGTEFTGLEFRAAGKLLRTRLDTGIDLPVGLFLAAAGDELKQYIRIALPVVERRAEESNGNGAWHWRRTWPEPSAEGQVAGED